jgi:hypothetical protein
MKVTDLKDSKKNGKGIYGSERTIRDMDREHYARTVK